MWHHRFGVGNSGVSWSSVLGLRERGKRGWGAISAMCTLCQESQSAGSDGAGGVEQERGGGTTQSRPMERGLVGADLQLPVVPRAPGPSEIPACPS